MPIIIIIIITIITKNRIIIIICLPMHIFVSHTGLYEALKRIWLKQNTFLESCLWYRGTMCSELIVLSTVSFRS